MKTLLSTVLLSLLVAVPDGFAQTADSLSEQDRLHLINRTMRDVILPANDPENPDLIPVGYRATMPGPAGPRIAELGDHFWLFTTELIDRYDLYDQWVEAGRPEPIAAFVREQIPAGAEQAAPSDTAQAAPAPAAEGSEAAEDEPAPAASAAEAPWWSNTLLLLGTILLLVLLVLAYVWSRRRGREGEEAA